MPSCAFSGCLTAGANLRQPETPTRAPTACLQAVHMANIQAAQPAMQT
ncbi:hypothetical protein [Kingella sp. (in: b-proteobacteria)]|nr:hypothetical protein [Kingella sp. (in: b-proteobacteria)]MDO4656227.1 hypothetical protein [Kingella sp. (in: b-proteobacteria)]